MFYYTYKVTLLKGSLAGKYYYGQHRTKNLKDGYIGSGKKIWDYFSKYGKIEGISYVRQILAFYSDEEELNRAETELVGDLYRTDPNCLNLRAGGNSKGWSQESREKMCKATKGRTHWNKGKKMGQEFKEKCSRAKKGIKRGPPSEEVRKKISEARRGKTVSQEVRNKLRESHIGIKYPTRIGKPLTKYTYELPDGTQKVMSSQAASRCYLHKGVNIKKLTN